jgi:uncharacterized membrane protein
VREARTDAGTIVVGWLVKVAVVLAIFGISAVDAIAVGSAHLTTTDDANSAASSAAAEFRTSHNVASATSAAADAITNPGEELVPDSLVIARDGSVTLSVQRKITTAVMYRIGPLKKYTVIRVKGEATPPTS